MSAATDAKARRMRERLIEILSAEYGTSFPVCQKPECAETDDLEIDHPNGRKRSARNRNPKHRRKSALQRVRELAEAFLAGEPLRVLCRSCNAREGGGRRYT